MQTKQIIQSSANVIRITNIAKGNIYKRFQKDYDYTYYGIVKAVHNDGSNTIIEATEYRYSYGDMNVEHKVITGDKDYVIFPATLEEIQSEFESCITKKEKEIDSANETIKKAEKTIEDTKRLISGEMQKELSSPLFKEMTQGEFNEKLEALN